MILLCKCHIFLVGDKVFLKSILKLKLTYVYCIKYNMHMVLCAEHKLRPPLRFYIWWHEPYWVCVDFWNWNDEGTKKTTLTKYCFWLLVFIWYIFALWEWLGTVSFYCTSQETLFTFQKYSNAVSLFLIAFGIKMLKVTGIMYRFGVFLIF